MSADAAPILIAALSGRALAAAASRAGERTIVFDLFADCDTARYADVCILLPRGAVGFERGAFLAATERVSGAVRGIVYGAGFEHDPELLAEVARLVPVIGNRSDTLGAVKDPLGFAEILAGLGLRHPATTRDVPAGDGWLRKTAGGAGGTHIVPATGGAATGRAYFQRWVPGHAVSASFLANGTAARVIGFTEQWAAGDAAAPYRYGGCTGPVSLPPQLAGAIEAACGAIAAATGLIGLNSLDLLVDGQHFHVIEINPRPGATVDIFDGVGGLSLWRLHIDAVAGRLPAATTPTASDARAAAIIYAPERLVVPAGMAWPAWTADRGAPGTVIDYGQPICTVRAEAATAEAARQSVAQRGAALLAQLTKSQYAAQSDGRATCRAQDLDPASTN